MVRPLRTAAPTEIITLEETTGAEVSLDIGSIRCDEKSGPIREVRLKLKQGKVGPLYRLENQVFALAPMWLSDETNAARGRTLCSGQKSRVILMRKANISKDATAATALHQIIGTILRQVTSNVAAALSGDAESLRQLRRSLRNCRAVLRLFAPMVKRDEATRFNAPLRRFAKILGVARDWDVLCLQTLPTAMAQLPDHDWVKLLDVAEAERQIAHSEVGNALCGADFAKLLADLAIFSENCATKPHKIGTKRLSGRLSDVTVTLLEQISGKAEKAGRHPLKQSMIELHDFRKALDRLNAAIRFLAGHYPKPSVSAYRNRTDLVRDIIGAANDAEVTKQLVEKLAAAGGSDLSPVIHALVTWVDQQADRNLTGLKPATQRLRAEPKFWKDDSVV